MIRSIKGAAIALLCGMAVLMAGVGLLIVLSIPGQQRRDRDYEKKLAPSVAFVRAFEARHGRLPSQAEFEKRPSAAKDWMVDLVTATSLDPAFGAHRGKTKRDFAVRVWRGEQWTYYFGWNRKFDIVEPEIVDADANMRAIQDSLKNAAPSAK